MIFYFTGTGNSKYAAYKLLNKGEQLVDIGACCKENNFEVEVPDGERIGFCFPCYYGGLPLTVHHFLENWNPPAKPGFVFGVITCGSTPFASSEQLDDVLEAKGLDLRAVYGLKMVDNYVVLYALSSDEDQKINLDGADRQLERIKKDLAEEKELMVNVQNSDRRATWMMYRMYKKGKKTSKFSVKNTCKGCGLCVKRCPENAIEMKNGKPVWVKDRCCHCMSCMRCESIICGGRSDGRDRYEHPIMRRRDI